MTEEKGGTIDWGSVKFHNPKEVCKCDLFGQGQMVITFYDSGPPVPNHWIRFWTRVFFNSKWIFVK